MIYIFSSDSDQSTSDIIDWLKALNKNFYRVNSLLEFNKRFAIRIKKTTPAKSKASIFFRKKCDFLDITNHDLREFMFQENNRFIEWFPSFFQQKKNDRLAI
ncbi:MAG TPA: hypothetical protein VFL70_06275 [Bacteroidia bacterium]|nr:hypothetical protein [Bacteroidia bacterium]